MDAGTRGGSIRLATAANTLGEASTPSLRLRLRLRWPSRLAHALSLADARGRELRLLLLGEGNTADLDAKLLHGLADPASTKPALGTLGRDHHDAPRGRHPVPEECELEDVTLELVALPAARLPQGRVNLEIGRRITGNPAVDLHIGRGAHRDAPTLHDSILEAELESGAPQQRGFERALLRRVAVVRQSHFAGSWRFEPHFLHLLVEYTKP